MKRYLLVLVCVFQIQLLFSQTVDDKQAIKVAAQFIVSQNKNETHTIISEKQIFSDKGVLLSYLFSLSPYGYIFVSADMSYHPIVAYSFLSDNNEVEQGNPLIQLIKSDYSQRFQNKNKLTESFKQKNYLTWKRLNEIKLSVSKDTSFQQWPSAGTSLTEGWVTTKWTQSAPYNMMCPMDLNAGSRSFTGCPATAMAQIINYHQTLNGTRFTDADDYYHNYGSNQFYIDDDYTTYDFPSFPQLNLYLDTLENKYISKVSLSVNDMAALSFACGVATKSVYGAAGSGTFAVSQAYDGFIRMGFTSCQLLDTSFSNPLPQVINNIKDSLPALLAVVDPAWNSGHNLVIDGYNTNDFYHLNYGWGGSYNGWYNIPSGLPYNLTVIEGIVLDIISPHTSGISKVKENKPMCSILPNPAKEEVELYFMPKNNGIFHIQLFDALGRLVSERTIRAEVNTSHQIKIPLENIRKGIYSIQLMSPYESYSGKLIKL